MDKEFQTTFIPKKPMTEERSSPRTSSSKPLGIFSVIATLFFAIAILAAGAVYGYERYLESRISTLRGSLQRAEDAFEPSLIVQLQKLDKRLRVSETLLNRHVAVSPMFKVLETVTLQGVQFDNFNYEYQEGGIANIEMAGRARTYQTIAEQSELFGGNRFITDHIFSNFTLNDSGLVAFDLGVTMSPELVYFARSLGEVPTSAGLQIGDLVPVNSENEALGENTEVMNAGESMAPAPEEATPVDIGIPSLDPAASSMSTDGEVNEIQG
jgi:hypothetical protein